MKLKILQLIFYLSFVGVATAQQYPVDCRISITPPYANRFYDYQNSPQRFKVTLLLRDNTKPTLDVVLQIRLKGPGFVIENPGDFFTAQPITLSPGRPQTISGLELSDNFNPANLETQGIELTDLFTGVGLPPGPYEWEVRAYELYRDRQVSNTASFRMNLALNYPPLLNQPANKAQLNPTQPQSLNFSWMPRPSASLAASQGLLYTMMLFEVPAGEDPNAVVNSGAAPFRVIETGQTNYFYGPFEVPLEVGKTYAWQVQVSDINGQETYVNNGYSDVHTFTYGQNTCPTPTNMQVSVADDGAVYFSWDPVADASSYTLRYKPDPSTSSGPANEYKTVIIDEPEYLLLYQEAGRSYQYQLSTTCQYSGSSPYTPWEVFEIPKDGGDLYQEDTTAYTSDPELTYEPETFEPDETQLNAPEEEEPSIEDILNTPIKIYLPGDESSTDPPLSLPTSPTNLSDEEIKTLLKTKKPTCAGIVASYSCGNHDTTPMYSGAIVSVTTGDEVAMNSLVISIVDIDGSGNGSGKIKIPMFQNAEVGVTLSGIKVAEGGCVVEGKAELSGVDLALLNEQQRAKLAIAYDIFVKATDAVYDNADAIAKTYNTFAEKLKGIKDQAIELAGKLETGKATKGEIEALRILTEENAKTMQTTLNAIKTQFKDQVSAEATANYQKMIDEQKANATKLANFTPASPATEVTGSLTALANIKPAEIEKATKGLMPLMIVYNGKEYPIKKEKTINVVASKNSVTIKNLTEGEAYSWILSDGTTGSTNPIAITFPGGKNELTLEVTQGNRKTSVTLKKKVLTYTDLIAIDKSHTARKALASKGETLYLVRSPNTTRTINYQMTTTGVKGDFDNSEPLWSTTLPKNGLYEGEVLNGIGSIASETRHSSEAKGKVFSTAVGKMLDVKVEVVDQSRHATEFMPPGVSALLTSSFKTVEDNIEYFQKSFSLFGLKKPFEVKPLKIKGESYNIEDKGSRHYLEVKDGSINGGVEMKWESPTIYPPFLKFANIDNVVKTGLYAIASLDFPIAGGLINQKIHETGVLKVNNPFYLSLKAKGCIEAGLKFELLVAKDYVDCDIKGFGKACVGGGITFKNNTQSEAKIEIDPIVVGISAKVKSKGSILKFTLVDAKYNYSLTKPYTIWETKF